MKDIITFTDRYEALSFYIEALSSGIYVHWGGIRITENPYQSYYVIEIDVEKTCFGYCTA